MFKITHSSCWQDLLVCSGADQDEGVWGAPSSRVMEMPGVGFGPGLGAEYLTMYP